MQKVRIGENGERFSASGAFTRTPPRELPWSGVKGSWYLTSILSFWGILRGCWQRNAGSPAFCAEPPQGPGTQIFYQLQWRDCRMWATLTQELVRVALYGCGWRCGGFSVSGLCFLIAISFWFCVSRVSAVEDDYPWNQREDPWLSKPPDQAAVPSKIHYSLCYGGAGQFPAQYSFCSLYVQSISESLIIPQNGSGISSAQGQRWSSAQPFCSVCSVCKGAACQNLTHRRYPWGESTGGERF